MYLTVLRKGMRRVERTFGPRTARILTERVYRREFFRQRGWKNLAFGAFADWREAVAFADRFGQPTSFKLDHVWWMNVQSRLQLHDYSVLFWLQARIGQIKRVADIGGSVGVSHYSFIRVVPELTTVPWDVLELPDVVEMGRQVARERQCTALSFTSRWEDLEAPSVVLCAGAAQYFEQDFVSLLGRLPWRAPMVLLNRVPVHETTSYVTLQNTGAGIAPCRVWRRSDLIRAFESLGYRCADEWSCVFNHLEIPFHPELTLSEYRGYCFELNSACATN